MPRFDYDAPTLGGYEADDIDLGDGASPLDAAKKFLPLVVGALVLLGVAYFAYDFLVLSVKKVSFDVKDTEGNPVANAVIRVRDAAGNDVTRVNSGGTAELRRGNYTYEVVAAGFARETLSFDVGDGDALQAIALEKNLDFEVSADTPTALVMGQSFSFNVSLKNKKSSSETAELVFEGVLGDDVLQVNAQPVSVPGDASTTVTVQARVKDDVASKYLGKESDGAVRVKFTRDKAAVKLKVLEFQGSKVSFSPGSLDFRTVDAGDAPEKRLKLTNNNKDFTMQGVSFTVQNIRSSANPVGEVERWFSIHPDTLDGLEYGSKAAQEVAVRVEVPVTAKEDAITGELVVSTSYWEKRIPVELRVRGVQVNLELRGLDDTYSLTKDADTKEFARKTDTLELYNNGDVALRNVSVTADTGRCDSSWLTVEGLAEYSQIDAGEKKSDTRLIVSAPSTASEGHIQNCVLIVRYDNPLDPLERETLTRSFEITTR